MGCELCGVGAQKVASFQVSESRRVRWSRSLGIDLPLYSRICANHFMPKDFVQGCSKIWLMPSAVPRRYIPEEMRSTIYNLRRPKRLQQAVKQVGKSEGAKPKEIENKPKGFKGYKINQNPSVALKELARSQDEPKPKSIGNKPDGFKGYIINQKRSVTLAELVKMGRIPIRTTKEKEDLKKESQDRPKKSSQILITSKMVKLQSNDLADLTKMMHTPIRLYKDPINVDLTKNLHPRQKLDNTIVIDSDDETDTVSEQRKVEFNHESDVEEVEMVDLTQTPQPQVKTYDDSVLEENETDFAHIPELTVATLPSLSEEVALVTERVNSTPPTECRSPVNSQSASISTKPTVSEMSTQTNFEKSANLLEFENTRMKDEIDILKKQIVKLKKELAEANLNSLKALLEEARIKHRATTIQKM